MTDKLNPMYKITHWLNRNTGYLLMVVIIVFGFATLGFQKDNRKLLQDTKHISEDTQAIVAKQDQTLVAIKDLSLDNKLTSKQLGDTIICMLLVPVGQRTTQTQDNCRQEAINRTPASDTAGSTEEQPVVNPQPAKETPAPTPQPQPDKPLTRRLLDNLHEVTEDIPIVRGIL